MSTSVIKDKILKQIQIDGAEKSASVFGTTTDIIAKWQAGTEELPLGVVDIYLKDILKKIEEAPLESVTVDQKKILILRPVYKEIPEAVSNAELRFVKRNASVGFTRVHNDAMLSLSRNILAERFLDSEYEWSLWWDDDIVPPCGDDVFFRNLNGVPKEFPKEYAAIDAIRALYSRKNPFVSGLYYNRLSPHSPVCQYNVQRDGDLFENVPKNSIIPRAWVGTGFVLVHRKVYEGIKEKFPELAPKALPAGRKPQPWEKAFDFFATDTDNRREDVSFCKRAIAAGFQPYVDLRVVCAHLATMAVGPWSFNRKKLL